jgi:hypothetical protein
LPWSEVEPAPWTISAPAGEDPFLAFAAASADCRIVYLPSLSLMRDRIGFSTPWTGLHLLELEPTPWRVELINPRTGVTVASHDAKPDGEGRWELPGGEWPLPTYEDWLLVARRVG